MSQGRSSPSQTKGPLPGWPIVLREDWAAAYVGLSPSTFRQVVAPHVPPIKLTKAARGWRRSDLERWVDERAGEARDTITPEADAGAGWDAALDGNG